MRISRVGSLFASPSSVRFILTRIVDLETYPPLSLPPPPHQARLYSTLRSCGKSVSTSGPMRASDFKVYVEGLLRGPLDLAGELEPKVRHNMQTSLHGGADGDPEVLLGAVDHADLRALWIGFQGRRVEPASNGIVQFTTRSNLMVCLS